MLRVSLIHARPGMVLSLPVHHPRHPDVVLLKAGVALDAHCIPRLKELHVPELWIHYPGLEDLIRFVDPTVISAYRDLTSTVGVALDTAMVQSKVEMDFYVYKRAVMSVLDRLVDSPNAAVFVTELIGGDRPFVRHAGNVCVLSILMGLKLEFYLVRERPKLSPVSARDVSGLGVGAMFHDIGMTRLDAQVLARWNELQDESDPEWQQHVTAGFDLVKSDLDPAAAAVVLHHHQKFDGSGFPKREFGTTKVAVKGSEIHIFARIVGCADLFERLRNPAHAPTSSVRDTPSIPTVRALSLMRQAPYCRWVDPVVFLALLSVAPPYPPGSVVRLNDRRIAAVVNWSPLDPCRPTVAVIDPKHPDREPSIKERIDLRKRHDLEVAEIDGQNVSDDNFYPDDATQFDLVRLGKEISTGVKQITTPAPATVAAAPAAKPKPIGQPPALKTAKASRPNPPKA